MWSVWDKISDINGFPASDFLARNKNLQHQETIFIKTVDGRVTNVEGKGILARHYGIDVALPDEEFIAEYEKIMPPAEEIPEDIPEEEETDTTTYAELAQVYKEGVNGLE